MYGLCTCMNWSDRSGAACWLHGIMDGESVTCLILLDENISHSAKMPDA